MKNYLSILICLLFACGTPEKETPNNILKENTFENILKEIHLAEATFELHKTTGMEKAKNELANSYHNIYLEFAISEEKFNNSLEYYSTHPEKLEEIYSKVLEELTEERASLNPQ